MGCCPACGWPQEPSVGEKDTATSTATPRTISGDGRSTSRFWTGKPGPLTIHKMDPLGCSTCCEPLHRDLTVARPKSPILTVQPSCRKISGEPAEEVTKKCSGLYKCTWPHTLPRPHLWLCRVIRFIITCVLYAVCQSERKLTATDLHWTAFDLWWLQSANIPLSLIIMKLQHVNSLRSTIIASKTLISEFKDNREKPFKITSNSTQQNPRLPKSN